MELTASFAALDAALKRTAKTVRSFTQMCEKTRYSRAVRERAVMSLPMWRSAEHYRQWLECEAAHAK